jgi:hypothetical protein
MRADDRTLKAMTNLANHPDFEIFMAFLARWDEEEIKALRYSEQQETAQGRTQILFELRAQIDEARKSVTSRIAQRAVVSGSNAF